MQASVAGARYGDEPEYVAYRPAHCTSRGSAKCSAARSCNVRSGSIVSRSRGERIRRISCTGPLIGPAKNERALTSQIRRPCSSNRRQAAPAPGANASNASAVAVGSSGTTSEAPSAQWYRNCGSNRTSSTSAASDVPATRNSSSNTWGSVSNEGPMSNAHPS